MQLTKHHIKAVNFVKARIKGFTGVAIALILCAASMSPAQATVIPPSVYYYGYANIDGTDNYYSAPGNYGGSSFVYGNSYNLYLSAQELTGNLYAGNVQGGDVKDTSRYYFAIVGPAASAVPLEISFSMHVSAQGTNSSSDTGAAANFDYPAPNAFNGFIAVPADAFSFDSANASMTVSKTVLTTLAANTSYWVQLHYELLATGGYSSALVDPYLQIDPSFPNAGLYSIVFSPGVVNGTPPSAVSEPPSLYLFLFGLFLVATAIIRKQNRMWRR